MSPGTSWILTDFKKHDGAHPALYISPRPETRHTKVLLLVHLDVVPATEYAVRGTPTYTYLSMPVKLPMDGKRICSQQRHSIGLPAGEFDGKILGRGVSDMKGPAAALLHLMQGLEPSGHDLAMLGVA